MPDPQLYEIYPRLYVRGHTLSINSSTMLRLLTERQVQLVLNVSLRDDPYLSAACRTIGMRYQFTPMHDSQDVDAAQVDQLATLVLSFLKLGCGVLVHCDSGRNRSALIALAAMVKDSPNPPAALLAEARKTRPAVLANPVFEAHILSLR